MFSDLFYIFVCISYNRFFLLVFFYRIFYWLMKRAICFDRIIDCQLELGHYSIFLSSPSFFLFTFTNVT